MAAFDLLRKDSESDEGLEALLGSTLEDGTIRALQAPRTISKQVASGEGLKVEVGDIFDGGSSSLPEAEGWVESGIPPANLLQVVAETRVAVETLDKACKVVTSQASVLSSEVATDLKDLLGSVIRLQASVGLREDDDLAGTSLWEVARESREGNLRENASLASEFANLQLEVTGHDSVLEVVRIPLQRACTFMSRFCGPGELLGDGFKAGLALEEKLVSLEREVGGSSGDINLRAILVRSEVLERVGLGGSSTTDDPS